MDKERKLFLEQDLQSMMNIISALQFFADNAIQPKYKEIIDKQIKNISEQLEIQKVDVYKNDMKEAFKFGELVDCDGKPGYIAKVSDTDGYIYVLTGDNMQLEEIPISLVKKVNKNE
jgi:hypothetical protein